MKQHHHGISASRARVRMMPAVIGDLSFSVGIAWSAPECRLLQLTT
jgi:hypothetical protein